MLDGIGTRAYLARQAQAGSPVHRPLVIARADGIVTSSTMPALGVNEPAMVTPGAVTHLSDAQRRALASVGLGRRICQWPASLATGSGWDVSSGDRVDLARESDHDLRVGSVMQEAIALARQDGVAWVLPVERGLSALTRLSRPATAAPSRELATLQVLSYREAIPITWENRLDSPWVGQPRTLQISMTREGASLPSFAVHRSRIVRVSGLTLDPSQQSPPQRPGADLSALEAYWPYLSDFEVTGSAMAQIAKMLAIPILRLATGTQAAAGNERGAYLSMLSAVRRAMGAFGLLPLKPGDAMEVLSPSLAGVKDLNAAQYERLSAVEGAPVEDLLGMRVGSLGGDSAGQRERRREFAGSIQREVLYPALSELYAITMGPDPARRITFAPLDTPTALESAQVELARAQAAIARLNGGITTIDEERDHLGGDDVGQIPLREDVDMASDNGLDEAMVQALTEALSRGAEAAGRPGPAGEE